MHMPTIFILDDDPQVTKVLTFKLESHGYRVREHHNLEQGIVQVLAEKPDLLILDLVFPQKDGIYALQQIRAAKGFARLPIIILTNQNDVDFLNKIKKEYKVEAMMKAHVKLEDIVRKINTLVT